MESEQITSSKITKEQALENVKNLAEVREYLKRVPDGKVEIDNELEGDINVHVYEVKDGHTATFNWYTVSMKTGIPVAQFDLREAAETQKTDQGAVSGQLCYPSEAVPKGVIEAKRLSDGKVFILNHGGSEDKSGLGYKFLLDEGDYYLRFKVSDQLMGYSTTVCPTGKEASCGDTKLRLARKAVVKADGAVSGYDLCDYYFQDSNAPKF